MNSGEQNDRNFVAGGKDKACPAAAPKSGSNRRPSKKKRASIAKKRNPGPSLDTKAEEKTVLRPL
ncbi:hypothetical protein PHJA_002391100 [Phtheirospermum japonicum]|uniref:Uncharacterized protein n=1 Tax=Phtheirospermum japonicum TaxID=374723 RepID=A0A830D7T6_9LAMI|nr:hypothetical protein PHJA_002391100 [Phtheirospermum japonicum]